jgi:O-methyltransferase
MRQGLRFWWRKYYYWIPPLVRRFGGDEYAGFVFLERLGRLLAPRYVFSEWGRIWLEDHPFFKALAPFDVGTRSLDRKYFLNQLTALSGHLPGDLAECGCFNGASAVLLLRHAVERGVDLHLFDSFVGLSDPQPVDGQYWAKGNLKVGEEVLRRNLPSVKNLHVYKGWIPHEFHRVADRCFSVVHIDVDLYQPTWESVQFFYPRMVTGGIMVFDDYGFSSCPGAKKAIDDFLAHADERLVMCPTGQAFIVRR